MKRIILVLALFYSAVSMVNAQNLVTKIPANASMVIKYAGENFSKNLPLKKIDTYSFIKTNLLKALKMDTLTSLQNTGVNFEQDTYQYVSTEDSAISFVSLLHLNNAAQFLKLVDANLPAELKSEKKNGYEFLALSADAYLGWNNDIAVLVVSSYKNNDRYRSYYDYDTDAIVDSANAMADSAMAMTDTIRVDTTVSVPTPKTVHKKPGAKSQTKKQVGGQKRTVTKKGKPEKETITKAPPKKKVEIIDEEVKPDEVTTVESPKEEYNDSVREAKRSAWYLEQEKKTTAKQKLAAGNIIDSSFNATVVTIANDISYKKVVDPAAHVSVWINSDNLLKQYWSSFFGGYYLRRNAITHVDPDNNDGFRSGMNIYFDKDKLRIEQRSFSPDEKMNNLGKDLFNNKQTNALAGYVNPENLGYLSMSINSEAMANYYYRLIRQYLKSYPYINEYSDIIDVYVDLLEIIVDEKAIAELMPGNYMFVLHDMKTKMVTYTDYEYDDNFKYKEVKKTKQELSPNFTFVMETKRPDFLQKILKLPLKYAEKEKFNYKDKGGYYELAFDSGNYPLNGLYFMVKDGKAIITTSKASIDMTLNGTGYTLDAETKNSILNNNYSLKINSKRLLGQLSPELNSDLNKKISDWLEQNIGDIKMESSLKDGMVQGTTTMKITGNHSNSLEFFFNMITAINDIIENDKLEREKKLN